MRLCLPVRTTTHMTTPWTLKLSWSRYDKKLESHYKGFGLLFITQIALQLPKQSSPICHSVYVRKKVGGFKILHHSKKTETALSRWQRE